MRATERPVVKVAVDAMGGDYAPQEIVLGTIQAIRDDRGKGIEVILVGLEKEIKAELSKYDVTGLPITIVNTTQVIRDGESPVEALKHKPDASILVAMQLLKRNKVEAVLSMGSTGTVMVAAIQILGTIAGIKRPAVGVTLWGLAPNTVMFDLGTNVDCRPRDLFNFATIGSVIAKKVSKIDNPTVAILSNGAEEGKGNRLVKETYNFFKESDFNFIGNVEGNDIPTGKANVIVCDGFVGNVLVKYSEGLGDKLIEIVKERLEDKLAEKEISSICNDLFEVTHIADVLGGAMIYGLDGLVWIGHGRSKASQFAQSLWQVKLAAETGLSEEIKNELEKIQYRDIGGE